LGNVQRSHHQSRMIARKLLRKHMLEEESEHEIDKLIENLKSNLYYHGHPINRNEAKEDLKIKVEFAEPDLEDLMWRLYLEYSNELDLTERFNVIHEWEIRQPAPAPAAPAAPTTQDILGQIQQLAQAGLGIGGALTEQQIVNLAVAMMPHVSGAVAAPRSNKVRLDKVGGAYVEGVEMSHVFVTDLTIERDKVNTQAGPQDVMKQEIIWQRWEVEP
jgi:hypothetical protein